MRLTLNDHDTIIAAYAQPSAGPGWSNHPLWLIIRDGNGNLREECLQPREQGPDARRLYGIAAEVHEAMLAALGTVTRRAK